MQEGGFKNLSTFYCTTNYTVMTSSPEGLLLGPQVSLKNWEK